MRCYVYKEEALGYVVGKGWGALLCVLGPGGALEPDRCLDPTRPQDLRPATRVDFDRFRVQWHPDYEVDS